MQKKSPSLSSSCGYKSLARGHERGVPKPTQLKRCTITTKKMLCLLLVEKKGSTRNFFHLKWLGSCWSSPPARPTTWTMMDQRISLLRSFFFPVLWATQKILWLSRCRRRADLYWNPPFSLYISDINMRHVLWRHLGVQPNGFSLPPTPIILMCNWNWAEIKS